MARGPNLFQHQYERTFKAINIGWPNDAWGLNFFECSMSLHWYSMIFALAGPVVRQHNIFEYSQIWIFNSIDLFEYVRILTNSKWYSAWPAQRSPKAELCLNVNIHVRIQWYSAWLAHRGPGADCFKIFMNIHEYATIFTLARPQGTEA